MPVIFITWFQGCWRMLNACPQLAIFMWTLWTLEIRWSPGKPWDHWISPVHGLPRWQSAATHQSHKQQSHQTPRRQWRVWKPGLGRKEDTEIQKLMWEKDGKGKASTQNPNLIPFSGWILEGVVWGVKVSHDISVRSSLALGVAVAGEQIQYTWFDLYPLQKLVELLCKSILPKSS